MPPETLRPRTQEGALLLAVLAELRAIRALLEAAQPVPLPFVELETGVMPAAERKRSRKGAKT